MVTGTEDPFGGTIFSTLDLRGNVNASRLYADFRRSSSSDRFAAHDGGIVHLAIPNGDAIVALTRFDSNGVLQGSIGGITMDLGGGRPVPVIDRLEVAGEGSTIWVQWLRRSVNLGVGPQIELLLRGFDAQGVAITPEMQLEGPASAGPFTFGGVHAKGGRALAWWLGSSDALAHEARYAVVMPAGHGRDRAAVDDRLAVDECLPGRLPARFGRGLRVGLALEQPRPTAALDRRGAARHGLRAATIHCRQHRQRVAGQRADLGCASCRARGPRPEDACVSGVRFEPLWPLGAAEPIDVVALLNVGTTPLASVPARITRSAPGFDDGPARAQLIFADRVLLLGSGFRLSTTVVWLR